MSAEPFIVASITSGALAVIALVFWQKEREANRSALQEAVALLDAAEAICENAMDIVRKSEERFAAIADDPTVVDDLSDEERQLLIASRCSHCGGAHSAACPRVKRIRFRSDGQTPLEVEFWQDGSWDVSRVVWLDDIVQKDTVTVIA